MKQERVTETYGNSGALGLPFICQIDLSTAWTLIITSVYLNLVSLKPNSHFFSKHLSSWVSILCLGHTRICSFQFSRFAFFIYLFNYLFNKYLSCSHVVWVEVLGSQGWGSECRCVLRGWQFSWPLFAYSFPPIHSLWLYQCTFVFLSIHT